MTTQMDVCLCAAWQLPCYRRTRLITCVEGKMAPQQLQEVLAAGLADHGPLLWQEQAERQQRVSEASGWAMLRSAMPGRQACRGSFPSCATPCVACWSSW